MAARDRVMLWYVLGDAVAVCKREKRLIDPLRARPRKCGTARRSDDALVRHTRGGETEAPAVRVPDSERVRQTCLVRSAAARFLRLRVPWIGG